MSKEPEPAASLLSTGTRPISHMHWLGLIARFRVSSASALASAAAGSSIREFITFAILLTVFAPF
jgi:hypothetical protein